MIICRNVSAAYLSGIAERMGDCATLSQAQALVEALITEGYELADTATVPADTWGRCLDVAAPLCPGTRS